MPPTRARTYYSVRSGKNPAAAHLTLDALKVLFVSAYEQLEAEGYFSEHFGYWCVDNDDVPGKVGANPNNYVMFHLRRPGLWPLEERANAYDENDLLDIIEFLHDHVSKPVSGFHHTYNGCGMHWETWNQAEGQRAYRAAINPLLESYGPGYQLNNRGEILEVGPAGLKRLLEAKPPTKDRAVTERIQSATDRFRRFGASFDDRRAAVRELADVLEWLRPQIKVTLLKKDETELFQLANNFGIRHLNQNQKLDYDPAVWLSWMFYHYLATIFACLHLIERQNRSSAR